MVDGVQPRSASSSASRGLYAFAIGKGLTDGVWWFYLFYLPQFLNRNYGLDLKHAYWLHRHRLRRLLGRLHRRRLRSPAGA